MAGHRIPNTRAGVAALIDHTLLRPSATRDEIIKHAEVGRAWGVAAVCVNPIWVPQVVALLQGSRSVCCTVAGFPLGASLPEVTALEAGRAVAQGAREIDMVLDIGAARCGEWERLARGIATVKHAVGANILKVILEVCELTNDEMERATREAIEAGADFVKTSTGLAKGGATVDAVTRMAQAAQGRAGIKAAGGIRDLATLQAMLAAGATRIGTSATKAILDETDQA